MLDDHGKEAGDRVMDGQAGAGESARLTRMRPVYAMADELAAAVDP
jgi:hypothetical protein